MRYKSLNFVIKYLCFFSYLYHALFIFCLIPQQSSTELNNMYIKLAHTKNQSIGNLVWLLSLLIFYPRNRYFKRFNVLELVGLWVWKIKGSLKLFKLFHQTCEFQKRNENCVNYISFNSLIFMLIKHLNSIAVHFLSINIKNDKVKKILWDLLNRWSNSFNFY